MRAYRVLVWPLAILVIGFIYNAAKEETPVSSKIPEPTVARTEKQTIKQDGPTAQQQKQSHSQEDTLLDLATQAPSRGLEQAQQEDLDAYHDRLELSLESPLPRVIVAGTPLENMPQLSLGEAR